MRLLTRLVRDEQGQDLIEYAFLATFIGLAVVVGLNAVTNGLKIGFSNLGTQVSSGS